MTGWSRDHILYELPLYAGLQLLDYDNWSNKIPRIYLNDHKEGAIDNLATIMSAFNSLKQNGKV